MKKIIVTGAIAAVAAVSFAGTTNAAPAEPNANACFGQMHKLVNSGGIGLDNVGQLVQLKVEGEKLLGQGKNATAKTFC